jgi:uncharacterized protein YndB with AHSA1/START domain
MVPGLRTSNLSQLEVSIMTSTPVPFNPVLDLQLVCELPITPAQAFQAWTVPELLKQWMCPRPWSVATCQIDLRPGGRFSNVMQSPEGEQMPENIGSFLAIEPGRRLVWTNLLGPDFLPCPVPQLGFGFVCELRFDPMTNGATLYQATVRHMDEAGKRQHEAMGFDAGWRAATAQMVELMGTSTD